jgi:hypothetical protein
MAEASQAAVAATAEMLSELVDKVPVEGHDVLREELGMDQEQPVEAPEGASGQEAVVAQPVVQETTPVPSYEVEVPQDILDELDEPDFTAEAEAEVNNDEDLNYEDGDTEERKKRIAAEKRTAWLEGRLADQSRAKWKAEATKYFPLSEHALNDIKADSRRAFLREARAAHDSVVPYIKPLIEKLKAAEEQAKAEGALEGRQEARVAWGNPTTGPGSVPVQAGASNAELAEARKSGNLAKVISVMRKQATGAKE